MNQDLLAKAKDNTIRISPLKLANVARSIVNKKAKNKYIKVKQKRLDQILEPFNEIKINYIKSNIEGSEKELLIGLNKSKLLIENWCISCHDFKGIEYKSYDFVLSWLKKSGYKTLNYTPHNTKNIWRNYYLYGSKNNDD